MTGHGATTTLRAMHIDIKALDERQLKALIAAAERRLQLLAQRRSAAVVRRELVAAAAECGYSIEELFAGASAVSVPAGSASRRRRKTGKVAPKYRDPENRRNTWTGRGRMPRWLADKTRHGRSATDFLIPGLARPTTGKDVVIGRRSVFKQK